MNIGNKTSWKLAAVVAAALLTGVAQANDRDSDRHGQREYSRQHDRSDRHHGRYDNRHSRYDNRHGGRRGRGHRHHHDSRWGGNNGQYNYGQYNYDQYSDGRYYDGQYNDGQNRGRQNRRLLDDLEALAPPFSPPWLYRHGLLGR